MRIEFSFGRVSHAQRASRSVSCAAPGKNPRRARGFTLVELLVVVAIIAILMLLAMPMIGRALEQARQADCASNLRSFSVAVLLYRNDRDQEPIPTPAWLSNLYPSYVSDPFLYLCRTDRSRGRDGSRPNGVFADEFAETDDTEFNPAGPTAYGRNSDIQRCSYMYEFSAAPCSWNWASYLGVSLEEVDRNGDGVASWAEVKHVQMRNGDSWNKHQPYGDTMFPMIRCFNHHAFKKLQTPSGLQAWTLNVAYSGGVFEAPLYWEYNYAAP